MTKDSDIRTDSGGDDLRGSDEGGKGKRGKGKETTKVVILLALVAAGGLIVAYQFLGGSPKPAKAETSGAPAADTAAPPGTPAATGGSASGASSTPGRPGAEAADDKGEAPSTLSVAMVEDMAKRLDTYVQERQLSLIDLHVNPFQVTVTKEAATATGTAASLTGKPPAAGSDKPSDKPAASTGGSAVGGGARGDKPAEKPTMIGRFTLGTVMTAGTKRLAIINGKLCRVGDIIEGCTVDAIEPGLVTLSRDGDTLDLTLRTPPDSSKGN
jgi:hypothetical protein